MTDSPAPRGRHSPWRTVPCPPVTRRGSSGHVLGVGPDGYPRGHGAAVRSLNTLANLVISLVYPLHLVSRAVSIWGDNRAKPEPGADCKRAARAKSSGQPKMHPDKAGGASPGGGVRAHSGAFYPQRESVLR